MNSLCEQQSLNTIQQLSGGFSLYGGVLGQKVCPTCGTCPTCGSQHPAGLSPLQSLPPQTQGGAS